jgi:alkanesulfonate monooxygenase SsuD/methylene tetrahydromethanopterin reductase-like flavin-dependent oxidoreductase (luciferase family)
VSSPSGLGVYLQGLPPDLTVQLGQDAERRRFDSVWFSEITFGDAIVPATAVATRTERIQLATGIVGIWSRSLVTTAMTAATLHAVSGERFALGIGLQSRTYVNSWHGSSYRRPVQAVREALTILRRILDGEAVTYDGEIFRVKGFQLQMPPPATRVPLYLAAIGAPAVEVAGELADGLLGYVYSLPYFEQVVLPALDRGAKRAGRSLDGFDIACGFPAIVGEEGIAGNKGQVVMFATALKSAPAYAQSVALAGFEREQAAIQQRVAAGDPAGATRLVPDEMADALTISGPVEHVRERIAQYRAAGMDTVVLNPSPPGGLFPLYEEHFPQGSPLPELDYGAFVDVVRRTIAMGGA